MSKLNKYTACSGKDRRKKRRSAYMKLFGVFSIAFAVFIFATIAWFASNKGVTANTGTVSVAGFPFDIATKGSKVRYYDVLDEWGEELGIDYQTGSTTAIDEETYHTGDKLRLRYDSGEGEIGPGDSGELQLYVIPRIDDALDITVTLGITAYAEIEKFDADNQPIYQKDENDEYILDAFGDKIQETQLVEINSDFAASAGALHNADAVSEAAEYIKAADYLRGHILFFGENGDTSNQNKDLRYYYKKPYTQRTITKSIAAGNKDEAIQIPVYWMWTDTLGQILLPDNSSNKRNGLPILSDTDTTGKAAVKQYLISEKAKVFANSNVISDSYINEIADPESFDAGIFKTLSDGYNNADFSIGSKVRYFLIEVTVEST